MAHKTVERHNDFNLLMNLSFIARFQFASELSISILLSPKAYYDVIYQVHIVFSAYERNVAPNNARASSADVPRPNSSNKINEQQLRSESKQLAGMSATNKSRSLS